MPVRRHRVVANWFCVLAIAPMQASPTLGRVGWPRANGFARAIPTNRATRCHSVRLWESADGDWLCVGSVEELGKLTGKKVSDLHKHKIDDLETTLLFSNTSTSSCINLQNILPPRRVILHHL